MLLWQLSACFDLDELKYAYISTTFKFWRYIRAHVRLLKHQANF
jgi:hypothetical protein